MKTSLLSFFRRLIPRSAEEALTELVKKVQPSVVLIPLILFLVIYLFPSESNRNVACQEGD